MTLKNVILSLVFSIVFVLPTMAENNLPVTDNSQELVIKPEVTVVILPLVDGSISGRATGSQSATAQITVVDENGKEIYSRTVRGGDTFIIPRSVLSSKYKVQVKKANGSKRTLLKK